MEYLILENIRSAYNVGAIFRTADAAGVSRVFLVGYTPAPTDRFGRVQPEIEKTSLGASEIVPWKRYDTTEEVIDMLKGEGVSVVAVEQGAAAKLLPHFTTPERVAYIFGNEIDGVSANALALSDTVVEIPMLGKKESLNVSVAVGIMVYHGLVV